jgi:hypothetical protein
MIVPSKTVWSEYPGFKGFEVELAYLTKDELIKIRSKAVTTKISRKTRAVEEDVDSDLFQTLYITAVVKCWKGLKASYLLKMIPVTLEGIEDPEEVDVEYSEENAETLMRNSSDFDSWVSNVLEDVENFTVAK